MYIAHHLLLCILPNILGICDFWSYLLWRKRTFLSHLKVSVWVQKLNWQRQINRRKHTNLTEFLHVEPSQENEDLEKWPEQEAFISFRGEKIVKHWQDKVILAGVVNGEEVTRKIRLRFNQVCSYRFLNPTLPISGGPQPFFPSSRTDREHTFHMGVLWSVSWRKGKDGWSEWASCFCHFFKFLQPKILNMPRCHSLGSHVLTSIVTWHQASGPAWYPVRWQGHHDPLEWTVGHTWRIDKSLIQVSSVLLCNLPGQSKLLWCLLWFRRKKMHLPAQ